MGNTTKPTMISYVSKVKPSIFFSAAMLVLITGACGSGNSTGTGNAEVVDESIATVSMEASGIGNSKVSRDEYDQSGQSDQSSLPTMISIHAHLDDDWQPYENPNMVTVDLQLRAETTALITAVANSLNHHDIVANFQMSYGMASALCETDEGQDLVDSLLEDGHEIGIHTHGSEYVDDTYDALVGDCGVTPVTASGIQFSIATARPPEAGSQEWLTEVHALGMSTVLAGLGLSTNSQSFVCDTYDGEIADADANALLHSWLAHPDDICLSDPSETLAIVTHSDREVRATTSIDTRIDNIAEGDLSLWEEQLDAAVPSADAASTWGIVMALPAMMDDGAADEAFLAEFETFLGRLATRVAANEIVSMTASEAGSLLRRKLVGYKPPFSAHSAIRP
ncbi:MAG: hypothetical protein P8R42_04850 [Candidatus Binatia bacterium]|nr:hypothetical protein [Candidatus Binatia bacterium]